jgi:NADH-quinone oxidoreductase subunit H
MWYIVLLLPSFIIYTTARVGETNRAPFDLPEAENELIGGYHTEYSSMKLGFFLFAEYINMFISSAVISSLYFGGYNFPFVESLGLSHNLTTLVGTGIFFGKVFFFIFFFMWIRWTIPRFRYDQLMHMGWRILIPLALLNILGTAFWVLYQNGQLF